MLRSSCRVVNCSRYRAGGCSDIKWLLKLRSWIDTGFMAPQICSQPISTGAVQSVKVLASECQIQRDAFILVC